ncbi:MAG: hypothetical protein LBK13_02330 [Spirochaetales bacterium]|jgi:hypothetical protein|nr:hypothetical protein [Spirochaetales bacterium]
MKVIVSYHSRDTYSYPDDIWQEAAALCNGDENSAFDFLLDEHERGFFSSAEVSSRYVEVLKE